MGDNKAMLDVMKSLDKKIKSTKKNTPKQVSYLVRFNTTEEDFSKEREELFKAQLSAFMRDNIPMDIPEIIPYERKPISLEKEKIEKENDLPPVYAGHSRTPVITIEHMGELPSKGTPNTIYCIRNDKCSPWSWVEGEGAYYLLGINTTIETETKGTIRPYEITDYNAKRYNEEARRKGATFADKTKVDLMSAKDIRLAELCSEYNDGSIGKS